MSRSTREYMNIKWLFTFAQYCDRSMTNIDRMRSVSNVQTLW